MHLRGLCFVRDDEESHFIGSPGRFYAAARGAQRSPQAFCACGVRAARGSRCFCSQSRWKLRYRVP